MTIFFKKQELNAVASVITSLLLVSGCRSASVSSTPGNNAASGAISSPPFYRSYPQAPQPYDGDTDESSPQPTPPSVLPTPGYSEPEVPPAPSVSKSRWNFMPSSFKLPTMNRQNSDVRQMAAKSDDRHVTSKSKKNKSSVPTLRDDESDAVEEVVRPRSAVANSQSSLPQLRTSATQLNTAPAYTSTDSDNSAANPSTTVTPQKPQIRSRYSTVNQWPSANTGTLSETASNAGVSVPRLPSASTADETPAAKNDVPRLLIPND